MTEEQIKNGFSSALPYIYEAGMFATLLTFNFGASGLNQAAFLGFCGVGAFEFYLGCKKLQYMNTPEYREYIDLYKEYVSDIALMFDELGFNSDFSAAIAYKYCLNLGIFSSEMYKYTLYENDRERIFRYSGARVATGACCCRHNASLLSDILIQRGSLAPKIFVHSGAERKLKPNHVVTGILHNDKKLIIDPTMGLNFLGTEGIYLFRDGSKRIAESLSDRKIRLVSCKDIDNNNNMKMLREFMKYDSLTDEDEIISYYNSVQGNLARHIVDFGMFHMDEKPKILQLAKLNEKFTPHGKIKNY